MGKINSSTKDGEGFVDESCINESPEGRKSTRIKLMEDQNKKTLKLGIGHPNNTT